MLILTRIALQITGRYGGSFEDNFTELIAYGSIFILAWLFTFPSLILRKKIPLQINIDSDNKFIELILPQNKSKVADLYSAAYSYYSYNGYSSIVLYTKFRGRFGNTIYGEFISILGIRYGIGWKKETIDEIAQHLNQLEVELRHCTDKAFVTRLLE